MELDANLTIIVSVLVISLVAGWIGKGYIATRLLGSKPLKKEMDYWVEYSESLEDEIKVLNGKLAYKDKPPSFKGEVTKDNISDVIGNFFPMFAEFLPKYVQPFFKQPVLQKMMIDWAVKHPDQAAGMIGKFFNKNTGTNQYTPKDLELEDNSGLPQPTIY